MEGGMHAAIGMLNDFRYAFRALRSNPGFALTAIVSVALGAGSNSAIFSLADGLLFRPLPVPKASQVLTLRSRTPSGRFGAISYRDFEDFRDRNRSFDGLMAYQLASLGFAADQYRQPQLKVGLLVSSNFFQVLGVEPRLGRGFTPEEVQAPGRDAVVVLSADAWKNEFAADPGAIGHRLRLNGVDFTIVGIAPKSFTGMDQYIRPMFYVPAMIGPKLLAANRDLLINRGNRGFTVKGRLKPGVSMKAADADVASIAKSLEQSFPDSNRAFGAALRTEIQARMDFSEGDSYLVALLFSIVLVVLVIACANVANLMLSRGGERSKEIAVRLAIGASRGRLIRQLMAEALLIAFAGGAAGLLIAFSMVQTMSSIEVPGDIPIQLTFALDQRVLWFTLFVSLASALLFGLAPALQATRSNLITALKTGASDQVRRRFFGRNTLVSVQIAGSLVLLVAATQMSRGFSYLLSHSPGFRTDHLLMMSFDTALAAYSPAQTEQFYKNVVERARELPGVKSAALTFSMPMTSSIRQESVKPEGFQFPRGQDSVDVLGNIIDERYLNTFGVALILGRDFLASDRANSPLVAVVNETFARHYFNGNPLGKRIMVRGHWTEIVGVTAAGKYSSVVEPPTEFVYLPLSQNPQTKMALLAESYGDPAALAAPLEAMVHSLDANLPVFSVRTMSDLFQNRVKVMHLVDGIVASVGLAGLGLALVGLYAVVAYQVARRTREIGIRMALGADWTNVVRMIGRQAAIIGLAGIGAGMILRLSAERMLTASLNVPAFDPVLLVVVPVGLLLTTVLAAAIPARNAARIDPMLALRQD
jgi:macrolide transport system ATP-binding/permease protein